MNTFSISKFLYRSALTLMAAAMGTCLTGCIKDDLSKCPTTGDLVIKVTFFNNTIVNRLEEEVTKVDFFVFDDKGLFYDRITDTTGPFTDSYSKTLALPFGKYQVVVWGNLYDDTVLSTNELKRDTTTMDELRLLLVTNETRNDTQPADPLPVLKNFVTPVPTTLFWGKTEPIVELFTGHSEVREVDLLKDTHDVHVTLRWKDYDGAYCYSTEHQRITRGYITGSNGNITFADNEVLPRERDLTYIPLYRDPAHPDVFAGQTGLTYIPPQIVCEDHVAVMPDFRTMRLMADGSTEKLVVTTVEDDGTEKIVYVRSIVDLIRLTGHYNSQLSLDIRNDYFIVVDFRCIDPEHHHGSTWIALTIWVNGWVVKEIETEI